MSVTYNVDPLSLQVLSCECCAIVRCDQGKMMKTGDVRDQHVHSHILSLELLVDFD
jgi:hypothetical protein